MVDFPLFKQNEEGGGWTAEHHPFTAPKREHEELLESDPGAVVSEAYDMVLNGLEMASGSIRINRADLQTRVLDVIGIAPAEAEERFGFLLRALRFGAPPHGGIAPGIDRIAMQLGAPTTCARSSRSRSSRGGADPLTGAPDAGRAGAARRPRPAAAAEGVGRLSECDQTAGAPTRSDP